MADDYTARYSQFIKDRNRTHRTRGGEDITYQELMSSRGDVSKTYFRNHKEAIVFETANDVNDAFSKHYINSGEAQAQIARIRDGRETLNLKDLNAKLDRGRNSNKKGKQRISSMKAAQEGIHYIVAGSNGRISAETEAYLQKFVVTNRESLAQTRIGEKLRHGSVKAAKLSIGGAGKAGMAAGRYGMRLLSSVARQQMGGYYDPMQDEIMAGGKGMLRSSTRRIGSFGRSSLRQIQTRIQYRKEFSRSTVTDSDFKKVQNAQESKLHSQKKADRALARKFSNPNVHYANAKSFKPSLGGTAKGAAKGIKSTGKAAGRLTASGGRFVGRQFSRITTDAFGQSNETVSALTRSGYAATKFTARQLRKTPKRIKQTARIAKRAAQAASAVVRAAGRVVQTVGTVVASILGAIISALPVIIPIVAIIVLVMAMVSLFATCVGTTAAFSNRDNAEEIDFFYYADEDTILEAEEIYSDAEQELSESYMSIPVADAIALVDPNGEYGLTEDNTHISYRGGSIYHNPYNLISYLCVAYGEGWSSGDVYEMADIDTSGSFINQQYSIELSLGSDDADAVRQRLVETAESQLGRTYVKGGRGDYTIAQDSSGKWVKSHDNEEGHYEFDCSGLTAWTYLTVMGIQLDYNVSDKTGGSGQWLQGDAIPYEGDMDAFVNSLEVGDLVFMNPDSSQGGLPGHVGMYVGNGMFINSSTNGMQVKEETVAGRGDSIMGARRIIGSSLDTYNYANDEDTEDDEEREEQWVITAELVNNGFDATARSLLSGDALTLYLELCYDYGTQDEYYIWDPDDYPTYQDVDRDDFIAGETGDYDVDHVTGSTGTYIGSYIDANTHFMWPLPGFTSVSSGYGGRTDPGDGTWSWHDGIDIGTGGTNPPIVAALDGVVITNEYNGERGWWIVIEHTGTPYTTAYQHMVAQSTIPVGTKVKQGQVIGYVGATGKSFGEHLHFEVWDERVNIPSGGYHRTRDARAFYPDIFPNFVEASR